MRILKFNFITATDSYKVLHHEMERPFTEYSFSNLTARTGALFPATMFYGLQGILFRYFEGKVFDRADVEEAAIIIDGHLGKGKFYREGWEYILNKYDGRLPIRIKAVKEGTFVPEGHVLMTVESLDPKCAWLVGHCEDLLLHVWYTCTVATLAGAAKQYLGTKCEQAGGKFTDANFMLHDFAYRSVSSHETAGRGGSAQLTHFYGTDTIEGLRYAHEYYNAPYDNLAWSVRATEHSIMTPDGPDGELALTEDIIRNTHDEILSMVGDSYDIYRFTKFVLTQEARIVRNGIKLVIRPDSTTPEHDTPAKLVLWIIKECYKHTLKDGRLPSSTMVGTDGKKYILLPGIWRVLWGDGIDIFDMADIIETIMDAGFAPQNIATFGMGSGLLQKVNRDNQRFAFKLSAQKRKGDENWRKVVKNPLGSNKGSRGGRLMLRKLGLDFVTVDLDDANAVTGIDALETVFEWGYVMKPVTFDEVRATAAENLRNAPTLLRK